MTPIVGFDTEYKKNEPDLCLSEPDGKRNRVLSYQLWFVNTVTGREDGLVIPIANGQKLTGRLTLATLLGKGLEFAKREGIIDSIPDRIILVAHFWRYRESTIPVEGFDVLEERSA